MWKIESNPETIQEEKETEKSHIEALSENIWISIEDILAFQENIIKKIQALPPLPKTIIEIEKLKNNSEKDGNDKLLAIIESDPMITANILKITNSALYGFWGKIKTVKSALSMLGFNMASNIAISSAINNLLQPNLSPYKVNLEDFSHISSVQSRVIEKWEDPQLTAIKNELQLAAFLQEVGKIIIATIVLEKKLTFQFHKRIEAWEEISQLEEKTVSKSSAEITALIFKHWKLNPTMISYIEYSDKPENAPENVGIWAKALKVVKTISPIFSTNSEERNFDTALELAAKYWFQSKYLQKII